VATALDITRKRFASAAEVATVGKSPLAHDHSDHLHLWPEHRGDATADRCAECVFSLVAIHAPCIQL